MVSLRIAQRGLLTRCAELKASDTAGSAEWRDTSRFRRAYRYASRLRMPLNWDDDDEEELTEIEYKKRSSRVVVHDETTTPLGVPVPAARREPPAKEVVYQPPPPAPVVLKEPRPPALRPQPLGAYSPAPTRDRFAAFLIDTAVGFYTYFLIGFGLLK